LALRDSWAEAARGKKARTAVTARARTTAVYPAAARPQVLLNSC
jgi:hypothetical protein